MKFKDDDIIDSWKYVIPLGIIIFLVPLTVRLKAILPTTIERQTWKTLDIYSDFFSYNKGKVLIILACIAVLYMFYALILENITLKKTLFYIPMCIYLILALISSFFSEYRHIALFGFAERYEGIIILSIYMLLLFLSINLINSKKALIIILSFLFISASILCVIGLFQYFGYDIFNSYIGRRLILPPQYLNTKIDISSSKGTLYSTLMNSNYVGSYLDLTLPLLISLIIYYNNKKLKLLFSLLFVLNFATLIGCNSRAGFLGFVSSIFLYIVFRYKHFFKKKNLMLILVIIAISFVVFNKVTDNNFYKKFNAMFKQVTLSSPPQKQTSINDITLVNNNKVKLSFNNEDLYISLNSNYSISFTDEKDSLLAYKFVNENKNVLEDKRFNTFSFILKKYNESPVILFQEGNLGLGFILDNGTIKYFNPNNNKIYDIKPIESIGFIGKEQLASGRGYIWSRTLPMLKDTIFYGRGPDTFCIYFPQQEFIIRLNSNSLYGKIIDKPHNFYLGTAFSTGILSLIALLTIFIMYFTKCCKLYFNKEIADLYTVIGFGIFLSTMAYLASCMFNDSNVGVSSVFWILLGCGIAINMKLDKQNKKDLDLLL